MEPIAIASRFVFVTARASCQNIHAHTALLVLLYGWVVVVGALLLLNPTHYAAPATRILYQVCAGLKAEETNFIHTTTTSARSNENGGGGSSTEDTSAADSLLSNNVSPHHKVVDTFHSLASSVSRTTFLLALPQDAPISMASPFIQVK